MTLLVVNYWWVFLKIWGLCWKYKESHSLNYSWPYGCLSWEDCCSWKDWTLRDFALFWLWIRRIIILSFVLPILWLTGHVKGNSSCGFERSGGSWGPNSWPTAPLFPCRPPLCDFPLWITHRTLLTDQGQGSVQSSVPSKKPVTGQNLFVVGGQNVSMTKAEVFSKQEKMDS